MVKPPPDPKPDPKSKKPSAKTDAMRALREARYAARKKEGK